ncbi:MAG: type II secretion system protein [Patescibacteria group bacterium]
MPGNKKSNRGLTLVETLTAISIFSIALVAVFTFISQGLKAQNMNIQQIVAQSNARYALKTINTELRGAQYSEEGDYPIAQAENNNLVFYSDIDSDGQIEKLRYFLEGDELKKEKTEPEGEPPKYYDISKKTTVLAKHIKMNSTPIFKYYEGSYAGTEPSMTPPINLGKIRLIHITLIIDVNPNRTPPPLAIETEIVLRNLKDNL